MRQAAADVVVIVLISSRFIRSKARSGGPLAFRGRPVVVRRSGANDPRHAPHDVSALEFRRARRLTAVERRRCNRRLVEEAHAEWAAHEASGALERGEPVSAYYAPPRRFVRRWAATPRRVAEPSRAISPRSSPPHMSGRVLRSPRAGRSRRVSRARSPGRRRAEEPEPPLAVRSLRGRT